MSQDIYKALGQLEAMGKSAHLRIDEFKKEVTDKFVDQADKTNDELEKMNSLLVELNNWMHQTRAKNDLLKYAVGIMLGGSGTLIIRFLSKGLS